jgi:hypothetical protein
MFHHYYYSWALRQLTIPVRVDWASLDVTLRGILGLVPLVPVQRFFLLLFVQPYLVDLFATFPRFSTFSSVFDLGGDRQV